MTLKGYLCWTHLYIVIDALKADLQGLGASTVACPRQAPTCDLVRCTYYQWFQPVSALRRCCQLPVSGKNMKRFLQFRLGCHKLPIATGRRTGVARTCRLCTFSDAGAVGDKKHLLFECAQLAPLRAKYADLFNDKDHTMPSFFAQQDHLRVYNYVINCLNLMDKKSLLLCGTCDQPCWLAKACKTLLLLGPTTL